MTGQYKDILTTYWQQTINHLETDNHDYKLHQLPLARIKKVMKADPEVKMISAEAPILFAKGCDIFITELTMRAWIHAEENKRRTLQRSDIASALSKSDMFDFLIDIVPREEAAAHAKRNAGQSAAASAQQQAVPPGGPAQMPGHHGAMPQPNHANASHPMGPDYGLGGHGMPPEQDFRQPPGMYPGAVQANPQAPYGQAQPSMYGEIEGMYGYGTMQAQQVRRTFTCVPNNIWLLTSSPGTHVLGGVRVRPERRGGKVNEGIIRPCAAECSALFQTEEPLVVEQDKPISMACRGFIVMYPGVWRRGVLKRGGCWPLLSI